MKIGRVRHFVVGVLILFMIVFCLPGCEDDKSDFWTSLVREGEVTAASQGTEGWGKVPYTYMWVEVPYAGVIKVRAEGHFDVNRGDKVLVAYTIHTETRHLSSYHIPKFCGFAKATREFDEEP